MACEGVLETIRNFGKELEKALEYHPRVIVDLFELREDEIDFLRDHYGEKYRVEMGFGFGAPGNSTPHSYAIIRHKK